MEFWLIIIFLLLSGFFSGSETVFLSVNRFRLEVFHYKQHFGSKSALWFLRKPSRFILTTLVGTNLANIAFATVATAYLLKRGVPSGWVLPMGTLSVLIFGEIIPKSLGRDFADPVSLWVAPVLKFFSVILAPLNLIGDWMSTVILSFMGIRKSEFRKFISRGDLEILIRESAEAGLLKMRQQSHISRILRFRYQTAKDVMTPRTEIVALDSDSKVDELHKIALSTGLSKIPIFKEDIDHIIGVVYARDLFEEPKELADIVRPISFFPEQRKAFVIFKDLRVNKQSIAVIIDEWGGTAGLITVEDLIEELTGEIEDEYDPARLSIQEVSPGRWLVTARMKVDEINRLLDLQIPDGEYDTIGGYLVDALGRIPSKGETIEIDGYCFEILKATRTRVRVMVLQKAGDDK